MHSNCILNAPCQKRFFHNSNNSNLTVKFTQHIIFMFLEKQIGFIMMIFVNSFRDENGAHNIRIRYNIIFKERKLSIDSEWCFKEVFFQCFH
jgi:hypothetical protein